ncbi:hypothetical protein GGS20DRAFT_553439 [Poronia punctata]|nr:hypothetical protein GGS20DRAFT_553439 [Poronia punctata]
MYRSLDGLGPRGNRPRDFRRDALQYYNCLGQTEGNIEKRIWCQVSHRWLQALRTTKAAHIVPHFLDLSELGPLLFGSRSDDLYGPGNTLIMASALERWFDKYLFVIVPVDKTVPIRRWKTELIDKSIEKSTYCDYDDAFGCELHGKELKFRSENRPVSRFLYFHFVMALVRIKDLNRPNWQATWARYYEHQPFPTPGPCLRKSMLLAIATHFQTTDMNVVSSWISAQGFEYPQLLTDQETARIAKKVHDGIEAAIRKVEEREENFEDDSEYEYDSPEESSD